MRPSLLALALAGLYASSSWAIEPFTVKDIRVEGIQRTEAGTVFSYLPIKVGDTVNDAKTSAAIKALYATGFFSDVRLEVEGDVLVVVVQERPAIASVDIVGASEFSKDQLKDGLKQVGISEAKIFDKSKLDAAEKEIKRQYVGRGFYSAEVRITVTPLERNRMGLTVTVTEGEVARIRDINIIGAQAFKEKELLDLFQLSTPGWFTWISKNDQYSKQKLTADLETLRSHYLNRGYLEFAVTSTNVQITPDKKDIYITINVSEGPVYRIADVKLAGELLVPEPELRKLIRVKPGDVFSRTRITESTKAISERLGNDGYSFANVNAVPELDRAQQTAVFTFFIDPGRRVYVRRINISGNTRTRDEVVRRELRQIEGGWFSGEKLQRSKQRLDRTTYFSETNIETPPVPGTTDQVDVNISVTERQTGNITFGAGYSSSDQLVLSGSISQANVFGSGNQLAIQVNSSKVNSVYALSFTNPYFTPDGVAFGYDIYQRNTDSTTLSDVGNYETGTTGLGVRLGLPVTEDDTINFGLAAERTQLTLFADSPQRYKDFVDEFGETTDTLRFNTAWARDTRDSVFYPTRGRLQEVSLEVGVPPFDLRYYRLNYRHQWLYPFTDWLTMSLNADLGLANGLGGRPLPFFKNFYAGGVGSIRGYEASSLGPKDEFGNVLGGNRKLAFNAEALFPLPGVKQDKSVRLSAFLDAGNVFGKDEKLSFGEFRYSAGFAVSWYSPVGPLKFSIAQPLKIQPGDKEERFQFQLGTFF